MILSKSCCLRGSNVPGNVKRFVSAWQCCRVRGLCRDGKKISPTIQDVHRVMGQQLNLREYPSIHWYMFPNAHDTSSDVKYSDFVRSYVLLLQPLRTPS